MGFKSFNLVKVSDLVLLYLQKKKSIFHVQITNIINLSPEIINFKHESQRKDKRKRKANLPTIMFFFAILIHYGNPLLSCPLSFCFFELLLLPCKARKRKNSYLNFLPHCISMPLFDPNRITKNTDANHSVQRRNQMKILGIKKDLNIQG